MSRHPARWLAAAIALCIFVPRLMADQPNNDQVEREIDEIISDPDYSWLRDPGQNSGKKTSGKKSAKPARKPRPRKDEGCGYQPQEGSDNKSKPPRERKPPEGDGCSPGPAPGSDPGARPENLPEDGEGCQSSSPGQSCDCGNSVGNCGCDQPIGACNCGGVGAIASSFGYLVAALGLGFLVFLIVRAILNRAPKTEDSVILDDDGSGEIERVRVSEIAAIPGETMMDRAVAAAREGNYKAAVGWCYLLTISRLHRAGYVKLDQSTTNMWIVRSTRRNGGPHEAVGKVVRIFEDLFFGERVPTEEHWLECRDLINRSIPEEYNGES